MEVSAGGRRTRDKTGNMVILANDGRYRSIINSNLWKYVYNSTISEVVPRGMSSNIQVVVDEQPRPTFQPRSTLQDSTLTK